MHFTKRDIQEMNRIERLKIINSVSGIKPANLIGTKSKSGQANLAIFSSVIHLGSDPALLGFIVRPTGEVPRHTYQNILETKYYTINHVQHTFIEKAHYTSAKLPEERSEFDVCALTEEYLGDFMAPFVMESSLKLGMHLVTTIPIPINDTLLVVGEIEHLLLPEEAWSEEDDIDLEKIGGVGISGLNTYYRLEKKDRFPYVRTNEIPEFN